MDKAEFDFTCSMASRSLMKYLISNLALTYQGLSGLVLFGGCLFEIGFLPIALDIPELIL